MPKYIAVDPATGRVMATIEDIARPATAGDGETLRNGFKLREIAAGDSTDYTAPGTFDLVSNQFTAAPVVAGRHVDQREFLRRFTVQERTAIRSRGKSDPVVEDFAEFVRLPGLINLDHPDTIAGLAYLETVGILAAGRSAQIRQ